MTDVHSRLADLVDTHFGTRPTMPTEKLVDILEIELPKRISPDAAHEVVQMLISIRYLYGGYRTTYRSVVGTLVDAIRILEPATAEIIASGHAGERWEFIVDREVDEEPCTRPPAGWRCSRADGHDGPCAALPVSGEMDGGR